MKYLFIYYQEDIVVPYYSREQVRVGRGYGENKTPVLWISP